MYPGSLYAKNQVFGAGWIVDFAVDATKGMMMSDQEIGQKSWNEATHKLIQTTRPFTMSSNHICQTSFSNSLYPTQYSESSQNSAGYSGQNSFRPEEESTPPQEKRKRGAAWQPWEDRALARQVQADDPILSQVGRKEDRWEEVSKNLSHYGMSRSWSSCKNRMDKLVIWHKVSKYLTFCK